MTVRSMVLNSGKKLATPLKRLSRPFRGVWPRFSDALIGMVALAVVVIALLTNYTPLARYASGLVTGNQYVALLDGFLNPFRTPNLLLNSGLPIYDVKVSHQQYAILESVAEQARKQGWMSEDLQTWVNGKFFYGGEEYDIKLRIHGDLPPHWEGPKKSWSIKFGDEKINDNGTVVKEPKYLAGKRRINLIIPQDRDYILAYFTNALMREQGLVVPRDQFVILRINGTMQGLYYEVEGFDKPLLAAQQRPETTVFGENDRAMHFDQYTKYGMPGTSDAQYDMGSLGRQVDTESELGIQAMQVLIDHSLNPTSQNFRRVRAVLDWNKYLRFRVWTTLLNTNHVRFGSDNLKLYYDASRGLLEPVPWDVHVTRMPKEPGTIDFFNNHGPDEIERATLMDPELRLQRNKVLWEMLSDGGDKLMAKYDAIHERIRPYAWADVLSTPIHGYKMDVLKKDLDYNIRRTYQVLSLASGSLTFRLEANDRAALDFTATNFSGIQLQSIQIAAPVLDGQYRLYEDANGNGELDTSDPLLGETTATRLGDTTAITGTIRFAWGKYILPQVKYGSDTIDGRYWEFFDTFAGRARFFLVGKLTPAKRDPLLWQPPEIQVAAVNAATGLPIPAVLINPNESQQVNSIGIIAYDASRPFDLEAPERSLADFLQAYPKFTASRDHPGAAELSGKVTISGTVIVPKSVPLILRPGTDITMMPDASLVSFGGLTASGTPESRIRIHDNGSGDPWGTFAVVRPPQAVTMAYIDVEGGGQAQVNGILFTGGLAVYDADLLIEQCRITNMKSEDSLNLKNGRILMKNCLIANSASDAFDSDFTTGEIRDSEFINIKGDGVDLSGSTVTIVGNRFENVGDKGVSVGEDSHPIIINNLFRNCNIGISSKDLSDAKVAYSTFVDNALAIEAKRKKPMFGAGSGEFINNVFSGNKTLLEEDYFSRGLIKLHHSLVDKPADCRTCQGADIRFRSPETGDYRLVPAILPGGFAPVQTEWTKFDGMGDLPQLPGIFTNPPALWSRGN
ncbi:MAG: CotH kinase family protein [Chloroflexi bacterium]|nr:CotH kinase family protein [Chloroflexota bacterium]